MNENAGRTVPPPETEEPLPPSPGPEASQTERRPPRSFPRWLRVSSWIFGGIFVLLILIGIFRDMLVLQSVRRWGGELTGTKVELQSFQSSIFGLRAMVKGLSVDNPLGYHRPRLLELEQLYVDLEFGTVFSDVLVVEQAEIRGMHVNYEKRSDGGDNIDVLKENYNDFIAAHGGDDGAAEEDGNLQRSLLIRRLKISGIRVTILNFEGTGKPKDVVITNKVLENIGGEGESAEAVFGEIGEEIEAMIRDEIGMMEVAAVVNDRIKTAGGSVLDQLHYTWKNPASVSKKVWKDGSGTVRSLWNKFFPWPGEEW